MGRLRGRLREPTSTGDQPGWVEPWVADGVLLSAQAPDVWLLMGCTASLCPAELFVQRLGSRRVEV